MFRFPSDACFYDLSQIKPGEILPIVPTPLQVMGPLGWGGGNDHQDDSDDADGGRRSRKIRAGDRALIHTPQRCIDWGIFSG